MTTEASGRGLSLYDAARAMGVPFENKAVPQDKFVNANKMRFHYLEWGDPSSPPLVLLHGFAQTCHSWDFVALSLCDRYRVIVLDQRGHGDSDWAQDGDYTPETQQKDIAAIVGELGLSQFNLMGLSMGGRNSFTYAANHAEQVKALVIVDAGPENQRAGSTNIRSFVTQEDELDSVEDFVNRVLKFNPRRVREQVRGSLMHNLKQLPSGKWTWKYDRTTWCRCLDIHPCTGFRSRSYCPRKRSPLALTAPRQAGARSSNSWAPAPITRPHPAR